MEYAIEIALLSFGMLVISVVAYALNAMLAAMITTMASGFGFGLAAAIVMNEKH